MEEQKETVGLRVNPTYTIKQNSQGGINLSDTNMYLHKNNELTYCPFRAVGTQKGLMGIPCGEACPHFHFVPETIPDTSQKVEEGKPPKRKQTGKVFVKLTCGCGNGGNGTFLRLSNVSELNMGAPKEGENKSKIIPLNSEGKK